MLDIFWILFSFTAFTHAFLYFPLIKTFIIFVFPLFWFSQGFPQLLLDFFQLFFVLYRFHILFWRTILLALFIINRLCRLVVFALLRFTGLFLNALSNFVIFISLVLIIWFNLIAFQYVNLIGPFLGRSHIFWCLLIFSEIHVFPLESS